MAASSKALPSDAELRAVEAMFSRFAVHYGSVRMAAHWNGQNPDDVKRYWARKCAGMSGRSIEYALDNLPKNPPTVDEFREVARRCPEEPKPLQLTLKRPPEQDELGRRRVSALRRLFPGMFRPQEGDADA